MSVALSPFVNNYTVTDLPTLLPLIRKNLALNKHPSNVTVESLDWLKPPLSLPGPIDLILAVDCIYNPSLLPSFVKIIDDLTTPGRTEALVIIELRSDEVVREFLDRWISTPGWTIRRVDRLMGLQYAVWAGRKEIQI